VYPVDDRCRWSRGAFVLITRSNFVNVYLDPILYVLAAISVTLALRTVALPLETQNPDFVIFWDQLHWEAAGHDLYTAPPRWDGQGPNLAPPALLLLIAPLMRLPLTVAWAAWMLISVALFAMIAYWVARAVDQPAGRILSILLISPATVMAIAVGSFAAPIAACATRAWVDQRCDRDVSAGFWIGAAMACKPFLLPFVGYAVVRQRWRMCVGISSGIVAVIILGVAVFGLANTAMWVRTLAGVQPTTTAFPLNGSWMGWLARIVADPIALRAWWLGGGAVIGALLLWRWSRRDSDVDADWLGTLSGSLLASPLGWAYYAPLLVGPFAGHRSALRWIGYALVSVPLRVVASDFSPVWTVSGGSAYFWGFLVLFMATQSPQSSGMTARTDDRTA
jgi:glycosyl transferase family 87